MTRRRPQGAQIDAGERPARNMVVDARKVGLGCGHERRRTQREAVLSDSTLVQNSNSRLESLLVVDQNGCN